MLNNFGLTLGAFEDASAEYNGYRNDWIDNCRGSICVIKLA
jgi:hypothetical protein